MTDETAQPVMIPYAKHLEIVAEHLRPATGVVEALRELVAIEDDWQQRGFATGRTPREFAAWKAARAALAGQDKGTL
jgi:hypothetical protein